MSTSSGSCQRIPVSRIATDGLGIAGRVLPGGVGADAGDLRARRIAGGDVRGLALRVELRAVGVRACARQGAIVALSGLKPKSAEVLLEVARALAFGGRVLVVALAAVEAGIVGGVDPRALAGHGVAIAEVGQGSARDDEAGERDEPGKGRSSAPISLHRLGG